MFGAQLARRLPSSGWTLAATLQRRNLNIHEYQSLGVFSEFGVATPKLAVAKTPEEAAQKANEFSGDDVVIKVQVL
eukprot:CAMPEP_0170600644 /NCGR_PEP_ID=MMETSP0224-20130122/17441_1 /TAXON_ID=285029 /ORGANISM="Togula jolla, Strain CCCM 725" /LENGTH=75 /DNA_ID=CAMNT_0010925377 /DNA_START=56 /DNA_END=280 /DNA_ORIENTATION=+